MYRGTLFFLKPHRPREAEFVIGVNHKLNPRPVELGIVIRKIYPGSGIGYIADTD
jgi:hypothetical protein